MPILQSFQTLKAEEVESEVFAGQILLGARKLESHVILRQSKHVWGHQKEWRWLEGDQSLKVYNWKHKYEATLT